MNFIYILNISIIDSNHKIVTPLFFSEVELGKIKILRKSGFKYSKIFQ